MGEANQPGASDVAKARREHATQECEQIERERMAALGTLSAGVAHEINNPLTYVKILVGRLASLELDQSSDPLAQHRLEILQDIREGMRRIEQIVRSLRAFSQVDDVDATPVDVHVALEAALRMSGHEIHHRARLSRDYVDVPAVRGDVARLAQVFLHLIVNAAQSIPEGAPQRHRLEVRTRPADDGRVAVEIVDTGIGIHPQLIPHIFEPFFTTRPVGEGTGMGLSVCRGIVTQLGGEIGVTSEPGQGSCFRVLLPTADGAAIDVGAEVARRAAGRAARVLVVGAERKAASVTAGALSERYDVAIAGSGREALAVLRRERDFDVIVCDLVMPEMSGMELYETMGTLRPELRERFLFVSSGGVGEAEHEAREFIAHTSAPCLTRPFAGAAALDAVASVLRDADAEAVTLAASGFSPAALRP